LEENAKFLVLPLLMTALIQLYFAKLGTSEQHWADVMPNFTDITQQTL